MGASSFTTDISNRLRAGVAFLGLTISLAGVVIAIVENVNYPLGWSLLIQNNILNVAVGLCCFASLLSPRQRLLATALIGISMTLGLGHMIFLR
jgi:hypothetical protein